MKNKIKSKIINTIIAIIGIIAFDLLIKTVTGTSFIGEIIKAL